MKRIAAVLLVLWACSAVAQTGFPLWGSFEMSGFDAVNRQNLNVNSVIPLVSAPSRGGGFSYALVYDSLIWTKGTSGTAWTPVADASGNATWGWKDSLALGSTKFIHTNELCDSVPPVSSPHYFNYQYVDGSGTTHSFGLDFYQVATTCLFNTGPRTGYAGDNSGYYIDATVPAAPVIYSPSGDKIVGTRTDANGNYVSGIVNGSETDYKDTNGRITLKKVKVSSTQTQYQTLDQTGSYSNVVATATYAAMNVKTNFACTGVSDYTGTGIYLITQLSLPNGQSYSFTYEATPNFSGYVTGRIKRVTLPPGGYYQYDYPTTQGDGINCTDGSVNSLTRTIYDGTNSNVWQFHTWYTKSGTGTSEVYPQLPYDSAANTSGFTFDSSGRVTQQTVNQGSSPGTLLRRIDITYGSGGSGNTVVNTLVTLGGSSTQMGVTSTYDSNTNLLEQATSSWGTGAPGATVRDIKYTYLTGTAYTTANILNRVTQVLVKDGGGNVKARIDVTYDNYGSNMTCVAGAQQHNDSGYGCSFTARGNPTSITGYTDAATPSGGITTNLFYDSLGNVRKTDVNGTVQTQMAFSSTTQYAFPDSITQGPSSGPQLTASATYNANTGLIATATDANNQVTNYTYDNLRRLTDIQRPDSAHLTYLFDDVNDRVTFTGPVQGTDVIRQVSYLDSLRRVNKAAIEDVNYNTYSIVETQFDPWGRPYKTSNPHNSTAQYWTETDTDALGRITKVILPDGNQTSYSYSTTTATMTDPVGHQRKRDADALGRVITVYEPDVNNNNQLTQQTTYAYNLLNELTTVTQGAQTRSYVYDSLGRVTQATTPEAGQVQYQYNAFNEVAQITDARGVITTNSYDTLNRLYQTVYNVGSTGVPATPTATYIYGTTPAQYNNGRLITLATAGVESDSFTYDQLGRTTNVSKNITAAKTYNIGYGYNLASQVTSITYPSGRVITGAYDTIGRPSQLSDGTPRTYASQFSYNPAQELLGYTAGNGVQGTFGYSDSRLQLGSLSYAKGLNTLFSLSYGYTQNGGNNGQITAITDNLTPANSLTFTYDALGRLTRGKMADLTAPNSWDISWAYDRYGNRTNQTLNGGTLPVTNANLTFNNNNQPTGGFSFDASGNMTNDGIVPNYVYDANDNYVQLGSTAVNVYDAANLRAEKTTAGTTVVYVYAGSQVIAEYSPSAQTNAPTKEYVYLGSQLLATLDASHNPTYRLLDHLSVRLYTDATGNVIGTQGHLPFGEPWYSTGTVDKWKFTSYERDTDTSLDYALMRFNSARLARFATPDPYSGSAYAGNPQSWNRYGYVMNDPVNSVDPLGLAGVCRPDICADPHQDDDLALNLLGQSVCGTIDHVPVPCQIFYSLWGTDATIVCPGVCRFDYETGQWEVQAGSQWRTVLDLNGGNPYQKLVPIWVDLPDPLSGYSIQTTFLSPISTQLPSVSAWRPPKPTDQMKPPYKPAPYKPSIKECITNPGDAVDAMNGPGPQTEHDPGAPSLIYADTSRGTRELNPEGDAVGAGALIIFDYITIAGACVLGAIF